MFNPQPIRTDLKGRRLGEQQVGRLITAIGRLANVKVNERTKGDELKVKYASAHDLRRSFGERWAARVMPQVLMELMRHESIETTHIYLEADLALKERALEKVALVQGSVKRFKADDALLAFLSRL